MMARIIINVLCIVIAVAALAAAAWVVISGQIQRQGLDSLFLVIVSLVMVTIFAPMPVQAIRKGFLRDLMKQRKTKPGANTEPRAAPVAPQKSGEGG